MEDVISIKCIKWGTQQVLIIAASEEAAKKARDEYEGVVDDVFVFIPSRWTLSAVMESVIDFLGPLNS